MPPRVSIIMSAYNHRDYVAESINSVLNQTFRDFEFLIGDDHSTDGTDDIIRSFTDPRIQVWYQKVNTHGCSAFLRSKATGHYIAIIHSDDVWLPDKLETQVAYMDKHPECAACFTHAALIDESGGRHAAFDMDEDTFRQPNRTQAGWLRYFFMNGNCLCHPSVLAKREIYTQPEINRALRQLPDFQKWISFVKRYPIHVITKDLTLHRRHLATCANMSAGGMENEIRYREESHCILESFFDDVPDELFIEAFSKLFRDKKASTPEELLCEKYFLLLDHSMMKRELGKLAAAMFFYKHCGNRDVLNVLADKYGYSLQDYYKLTGGIALSCSDSAAPGQEQITALQSRLLALEQAYDDVTSSTIWRITKPLRKAVDYLKK